MTEWDKLYMNARRHPRTTPAHEVALYIVAVLAVAAILIFQP